MKGGAVVTIEGTGDEVADLLARFSGPEQNGRQSGSGRKTESGARPTPASLIDELIHDGFFSQPKGLGAVRVALQEKGHFYPVTTLSPLMLRLVRKRDLRRLKDKGHWTYVR